MKIDIKIFVDNQEASQLEFSERTLADITYLLRDQEGTPLESPSLREVTIGEIITFAAKRWEGVGMDYRRQRLEKQSAFITSKLPLEGTDEELLAARQEAKDILARYCNPSSYNV